MEQQNSLFTVPIDESKWRNLSDIVQEWLLSNPDELSFVSSGNSFRIVLPQGSLIRQREYDEYITELVGAVNSWGLADNMEDIFHSQTEYHEVFWGIQWNPFIATEEIHISGRRK